MTSSDPQSNYLVTARTSHKSSHPIAKRISHTINSALQAEVWSLVLRNNTELNGQFTALQKNASLFCV